MNAKTFVILPLVSILFLTGSIHPYAFLTERNASLDVEKQVPSNEELILLYLSCGNVNLMSQNYSSALDDYQKALGMLTQSSSDDLEFMILFGMAIACDNLHLKDHCEASILRIKALINSSDEEEDGLTESMPADNDRVPSYLRALADMAPSLNVRDTLHSFISEIFPSPLASYSPCANYTNPSHSMMHPCKSVWKKIEKLGRKIRKTCEKILDIIERCLDINDRIQGKPQQKISYQPKQERII